MSMSGRDRLRAAPNRMETGLHLLVALADVGEPQVATDAPRCFQLFGARAQLAPPLAAEIDPILARHGTRRTWR